MSFFFSFKLSKLKTGWFWFGDSLSLNNPFEKKKTKKTTLFTAFQNRSLQPARRGERHLGPFQAFRATGHLEESVFPWCAARPLGCLMNPATLTHNQGDRRLIVPEPSPTCQPASSIHLWYLNLQVQRLPRFSYTRSTQIFDHQMTQAVLGSNVVMYFNYKIKIIVISYTTGKNV